jgi:uncharacterized membrane protein
MGLQALLYLPLAVILLNVYALLLVGARGPLFRTTVYRPMILNIGLSAAPAAVMLLTFLALIFNAGFASPGWVRVTHAFILGIGGLIWLLLLPNSAYLITELNLSHRKKSEDVPLWYDIILVLTLAMSGVMNALANIAIAHLVLMAMTNADPVNELSHTLTSNLGTILIIILVAFGIYLGRYIRFNSWDLAHPGSFFRKLATHFREAANLRMAFGFVLTHSVFLAIMYAIVVLPGILSLVPS